jgi:hypothetical protein
MGVLEGTSFADVIISADKSFDWSSLPAEAGVYCSLSTGCLSQTVFKAVTGGAEQEEVANAMRCVLRCEHRWKLVCWLQRAWTATAQLHLPLFCDIMRHGTAVDQMAFVQTAQCHHV